MPAKGEILDSGIGWSDKPPKKVRSLRPTAARKRIAACVADIHFSHSVPGSRAETREEWYSLQKKFCDFLRQEYKGKPIFVAGDVTENWNEPPELINFLIDHMPAVYAVAGNHDLPNHQMKDIHRSAFWTLVQAGKIIFIRDSWEPVYGLAVYGYSYGDLVTDGPPKLPLPVKSDYYPVKLAVVHDYLWSGEGTAFPGVEGIKHVDHHTYFLHDNFDCAVFGDNHIRQMGKSNGINWVNPGPIMRRTIKEKNQTPAVAELFDDGSFEFREVPDFQAKWKEDPTTIEATEIDVRKLAELLSKLGDSGVDYLNALKQAINSHECRKSVRNLISTIVQELKVLAQKTGDRL
jgi:predicted phosphodiesterase